MAQNICYENNYFYTRKLFINYSFGGFLRVKRLNAYIGPGKQIGQIISCHNLYSIDVSWWTLDSAA